MVALSASTSLLSPRDVADVIVFNVSGWSGDDFLLCDFDLYREYHDLMSLVPNPLGAVVVASVPLRSRTT